VAKAVPAAQVTAVDWGNVLMVACENAARLGVADRYRVVAGSAFEVNWGDGYDLALITGFLHHFDRMDQGLQSFRSMRRMESTQWLLFSRSRQVCNCRPPARHQSGACIGVWVRGWLGDSLNCIFDATAP
jgi:hypothetical protein